MSIYSGAYNLFFLSEKRLFGVGLNNNSQLSTGDEKDRATPVEIKVPDNPRILMFRSGLASITTIVLTSKGFYGVGYGNSGIFGEDHRSRKTMVPLKSFQKIVRHPRSVVNYFAEGWSLWVSMENGTVYRNGHNEFGKLGNGSTDNLDFPVKLETLFFESNAERVVDIKCYDHTLLLTDAGFVYSCGSLTNGKAGLRRTHRGNAMYFERIQFAKKTQTMKKIAVGREHSLFLSTTGFPYSCGKSSQTGLNIKCDVSSPRCIFFLQKAKKVSCGRDFSVFLTDDSQLFSFGDNDSLQTGLTGAVSIFVPTKVSTEFRVRDFVTTFKSMTVMTPSGCLFSVGENESGEGGIGIFEKKVIRKFTPVKFKVVPDLEELSTLFKNKTSVLFDLIILVWTS